MDDTIRINRSDVEGEISLVDEEEVIRITSTAPIAPVPDVRIRPSDLERPLGTHRPGWTRWLPPQRFPWLARSILASLILSGILSGVSLWVHQARQKGVTMRSEARPAEIQVTSLVDGQPVAAAEVNVAGTVTDRWDVVHLSVNHQPIRIRPGSEVHFSAMVPLQEGINTITIEAINRRSEVTTQTLTVIRDTNSGLSTFTSQHFVFELHNIADVSALRDMVAVLEQAYEKVGRDLGYYPASKVVVIVFRSPEEFIADTGITTEHTVAVYSPQDKKIKLKTSAEAYAILHEYTHLVVDHFTRGQEPAWLTEGLAVYEESELYPRDTSLLRAAVVQNRLLRLSDMEEPFSELLATDVNLGRLAYLESADAIAFFVRVFSLGKLRELLPAFAQTLQIDTALQRSVGMSYSEFDQRWLKDLRRRFR